MRSPAVSRDRLLSLFREMVDIYSPSGKEEELLCFLSEKLVNKGFVMERQPVSDGRFNLLVHTGKVAPDTLFLGHIDTVPAYDIEQYSFSMREGLCRGLGTADMKGGCAALIEAFVAAASADTLPDRVMLALVVGEEETGDGTRALLEEYRFERALVAEPTDLHACLAHYGYVEMVVRAFGSRRHAAVSGRDTNAIRAMLRFLLQLEEKVEGNGEEIVLNIRDLHSSESGFAVPDRCAASVDLHLPPEQSAETYAEALRRFAETEFSGSRASRHEIEFPTLADGYRIGERDPLAEALRKVYGARNRSWTPGVFKSHSDANLLRDAGCCPVILGPGQLAKAHTRDESVEFEQVVGAAQIYTDLLALFGRSSG